MSGTKYAVLNTFAMVIFAISVVLFGYASYAHASRADNSDIINDDAITRSIEINLAVDEAIAAHLIDVKTVDGIVTLSGSIDNILARDKAERHAEATRGVRAVINDIEVRPVKRADSDILKDCRAAMIYDPAIEMNEVSIDVQDGEVIVEGNTDSWSEKRLITDAAKGVKGVKAVHNTMEVNFPGQRTDEEIREDVLYRLKADPFIFEDVIAVTVLNGEVTLSGTVGSPAELKRAKNLSRVAGVEYVDADELAIKHWAYEEMKGEYGKPVLSDEETERIVKKAFRFDPRLAEFIIDVDANNGVVTLSGIVSNLKAKRIAEDDARNTSGVWRVVNEIKVRPVTLPTDSEIESHVFRSLTWDPIVERHDIDVKVRNGKVYLYGTVDTYYEKLHAEDVVAGVFGVVDVANNIGVDFSYQGWKSDDEIREDVESELFWSPFVDGGDISVSVDDGVVTLRGTVSGSRELRAAKENAFEGGARSVRSRLKIKSVEEEHYPTYSFPDYYWPY